MTKSVVIALAIACSLPVLAATGSQQAGTSPNGEEAFQNRCSNCHGTDRALVAPRTRVGWENVVAEMVNNGAQLEAGESDAIVSFLTERHGLVNVNTAKADELLPLGLAKKDADGIVAYRTEHGPFADFAALRKVPGVDGERLDAARERIAFRD